MQIKYKLFAGGLIIFIGAMAFLFGKQYQTEQSKIYEEELRKQYEQKYHELELKLFQSKQLRDTLARDYYDLYFRYEDILRRDSIIIDSLKRVPKKYDKLTDKQTQNLMIEKWQKRGATQ